MSLDGITFDSSVISTTGGVINHVVKRFLIIFIHQYMVVKSTSMKHVRGTMLLFGGLACGLVDVVDTATSVLTIRRLQSL